MYRTVVITGASSGAGRAIAYEFALQKDNLVLASRNIDELEEVKAECESMGGTAICVYTDVTSYGDVINLASAAADFGGNIDIWINNAGVLAAGSFEDTPVEVLDQVIRTNLMGYIHGAHAVLPYFKSQERGVLINNISIGGFLPVPYGVGYSASKFGLRGFSASLRAELVNFSGIHICDAYPAFLDTPGIQHAANYTGKSIRPAPPVYDPARLAIAIAELAAHPKSEVMVGSASILLRYAYAVFPALTSRITAKVISTYLNRSEPIEKVDGNVFNTVKYGNAVHGGWGVPGKPKAHRKYIAAGLLMLSAAGLMLLRKK
ncbi:SDR family oxidoreductase [Pedobacter antarcticus]|uniref:SDR family oxidoreductase n=1 Tax=Pedobacter antarcticus TaxID=34086 RepID=UPI00088280B1|nr:SDR family oxidoreductase [Pedobacter antarcticus]SDL54745.1 Short-chain dehydrogenase [Pedobacter antarcticus]